MVSAAAVGAAGVPVNVGSALGANVAVAVELAILVSICVWIAEVTPSRYPISVLDTDPIVADVTSIDAALRSA